MSIETPVPTFSALQRAENSSIPSRLWSLGSSADFQCSSASRKFLNFSGIVDVIRYGEPFSALQRAENSSIRWAVGIVRRSALAFSALQRAENSSIQPALRFVFRQRRLSVLFSEPKIPQFGQTPHPFAVYARSFSALQRAENSSIENEAIGREYQLTPFSALQRAENSSIRQRDFKRLPFADFQCSSASRKFLNARPHRLVRLENLLSVLFSEPKIPQFFDAIGDEGNE